MTAYPNETVQDAANKLMAALALHEDTRGTVTDALHDMWDAAREAAPDRDEFANTLRAIRSDAEAVRSGRALTRAVPAARIISRVEQLLSALGEPGGQGAAPVTPDPSGNLGAAILRARDLRDTADPDTRDQISTWIEQARAAQAAGDADEIRRLLATPYVTRGGAR